MKQVIYSKYNRTRKAQFQIGTQIFETSGKKYVEKYALTDAAYEHIANMGTYGSLLGNVYANLHFPTVVSCENGHIVFEYVNGERLSDHLAQMLENQELFTQSMSKYLDDLFKIKDEGIVPFFMTEAFKTVFGDEPSLVGMDALKSCNIDMILDNVFVSEAGMTLIDNEWGMDFPIPVSFLKYRILFYFYRSYRRELEKWFNFENFLATFGVETVHAETFANMEHAFQDYVHGEKYLEQYVQSCQSFMDENKRLEELLRQTIALLRKTEQMYDEEVLKAEDYRIGLENTKIQLDYSLADNREKQKYILALEANKEENRIELDRIRYYKKHPVRRAYRICRRIGGKVYRKIKPILKKILPPTMYYKKLVIHRVESPMVSIVIPVYNEFDYTYKCIASIISNVKDVSYEIIIGDDESKDTTRKIKKIIKNLKVNINHSDHGFLMNCNRAAKLAEGKYIVFLNNDTLVKEEWLESLVNLIESDDKIGLVGSKLVYPDGSLQEAGGIIWKDATGWNYGRNQDPEMPEYNYVRECDYISGASIMISKALWEEIGGFDERFKPAYYEDADLAFEVRKRGYKVCYQPKSVVIHFEGVSNGTDLTQGLKKYQVENGAKFIEKWESELALQSEPGCDVFKAKERLGDKKVVLFVDHYVPTFDKDAGSRTVYQYIKIFLKKGYVVKFIGDNFAKMEPYTTILQQMGVEIYYGPWYFEHLFEFLKENERFIDYIFLNRPHISIKYIDFMKQNMHAKIMFYGSDLHYLRVQREADLLNDKEKQKEADYWGQVERKLLEKVDVAYYLSPVEKEEIAGWGKDIVVRNMKINIFDKFVEDLNEDFSMRKGLLFVGGFAHAPNLDAVKWFVNEIYPLILAKKNIPFYIVGSNPPEELFEMASKNPLIELKGFVSDNELSELYRQAKMAIVPLRYGAGIKGKVIEALYNGIPLVTTSVGAEGIEDIEKYAIIEDEKEKLADKILDAYDNTEKLLAMSELSLEYVKNQFSEDAAWKVIEEDFTN